MKKPQNSRVVPTADLFEDDLDNYPQFLLLDYEADGLLPLVPGVPEDGGFEDEVDEHEKDEGDAVL